MTRTALRGFALAIRAARAFGLQARWTFPSRANRRVAASGLFDPQGYLQAYPHAGLGPLSPLDHFRHHGARAGYDPNPYFATAWYLANNPDVARAGVDPLLHYIDRGEREGRAPSREFDPTYYAARYPDAAQSGAGLLAHFLLHGRAEGRLARPPDPAGSGAPLAGEADLAVVKPTRLSMGAAAVLLVCHAPEGRLRPHALAYVHALSAAARSVVVIAAADAPFQASPGLLEQVAGLYVRQNVGLDFAAWAHLLQAEPKLYAARSLLLANDSVLPPRDPARIAAMLEALEAHPADIVGLTDSSESEWHVQSYALMLKPRALRSPAFQQFMLAVRSLATKAQVIEAYELRFAMAMRKAGLAVESLYSSQDVSNPVLEGWRELLERDFPLVKVSVLQGRNSTIDIGDWRNVLGEHGFDSALAENALAVHEPPASSPTQLLAEAMAQLAKTAAAGEPLKLDYLGPWNFDSGLGAASRGMVSALWRTPFQLDIRPVRRPFHTHSRIAPTVDMADLAQPADVVVAHLNPDGMALMSEDQQRRFGRAPVRIGLWVWEMERVPSDWLAHLDRVDAVWTPSRYCAAGFTAAMGDRPIHVVPHVVETLPFATVAEARAARDAFALPIDPRLILYVFDGASYLARKNPFALVRAFLASGLSGRGWTLVLKTKHLFDRPDAGGVLSDLVAAAEGVRLLDVSTTVQQMRGLMAAADIYASPHCAEGFGLTIAEAMAMGKAVVATDYSGPRDFLDATCGYPVTFRLETLTQDHGHYRRDGVWAKIDEDALAEALLHAAADVEAERGPGGQARARIAERLSAAAVSHAIQDSVAKLTGRAW